MWAAAVSHIEACGARGGKVTCAVFVAVRSDPLVAALLSGGWKREHQQWLLDAILYDMAGVEVTQEVRRVMQKDRAATECLAPFRGRLEQETV